MLICNIKSENSVSGGTAALYFLPYIWFAHPRISQLLINIMEGNKNPKRNGEIVILNVV